MKNGLIIIAVLCCAILTFCYSRQCYFCLVQQGCLSLDIYAENATMTCPKGVEHCIISQTVSKVTGAKATDHLCGGRVYDVESPALKDGCFQSLDSPGARTKRTDCYCSYNLCNRADGHFPSSTLPVTTLFSVFTLFSFSS